MDISSWLIIILYLLLPLGQLQRLPLGIAGVSVYVHDLVLVGMWVWILIRFVIATIVEGSLLKLFKKGFFDGAQNDGRVKRFFVFTAIGLLSWLINLPRWGQESIIGLGYLIRWVLLSAPLFLTVILSSSLRTKDPVNREVLGDSSLKLRMTKLFKKSIFLLALFGWVQYLIFPDLTRMKYFGWDDHFFRLTGTLLDPNFMGILLVLGIGLEFSNFQFSIFKSFKKIFYLITLAFTYSRASYLSWLVLLFGWGINKIFAKPIKGGILKLARIFFRSLTAYSVYFWLAVSAIIFVLMPRPTGEGGDLTRTASISGRLESYQQVWGVIKKNPLFGVGFNNMRLYKSRHPEHREGSTQSLTNQGILQSRFRPQNDVIFDHAAAGADNSFLFVWATTGTFGLITFVWLVFSLRPWWLVLPIVIHSFFNNTLFFPWVLIYLWGIQRSKH